MVTDEDLYRRARTRVKQIKGLYIHAAIYVIVMLGLFGINASGTDAQQGNWWVVWPACIWGAALLINAVIVLADGFARWEERKVDEYVRRERAHLGG